jgi:hypothetical protein
MPCNELGLLVEEELWAGAFIPLMPGASGKN